MQKQDKSRSERFEPVSGLWERSDNFEAWKKSLFHLLTSPFHKPIRDLSGKLGERKRKNGIHGIQLIIFYPLLKKKLQDRWCGHLEIVCQLSAWVDLAKKTTQKNKQGGAAIIFTEKGERLKRTHRREREKRLLFWIIKRHFASHLQRQLKAQPTWKSIPTLLKKCDQSLRSQLGTGDRLWCFLLGSGAFWSARIYRWGEEI